MSAFEQGEVRADVIQEMRARANENADVTDLVEYLLETLGTSGEQALLPALVYFRAAFCLSLREVLPLREWLGARDRSEIDSILIPAIRRTRDQWQSKQLQRV